MPADAVTVLSVYLFVLFAFPSGMSIAPLGSYGRPSMLVGLAMAFWWVLDQLLRVTLSTYRVHQPVRIALFAFLIVAFISLGAALLRGQPADQISPAENGVLNLVADSGVLLVAMDGITTMARLRALIQRLVLGGALVAALGLAQFTTGRSFVDLIDIPGMSTTDGGVQDRSDFVRAAGTASHPLEYAAVLSVCLPLAIVVATDRTLSVRRRNAAWLAVALIAAAAALSVSRSALLGVAIGVALVVPVLPKSIRTLVAVGAVGLVGAIAVLVPGMLGTIVSMFTGLSTDSSAESRTNGLAAGVEFIRQSPLVGVGWATFLPRYYIFDNEWMGLAIQLGALGLAAFAGILACGMYSALTARRGIAAGEGSRGYGQAIFAALAAAAFLCGSFDALSFPQAAGMIFLLPGLGAALRRVDRSRLPPLRWRLSDDTAFLRHLTAIEPAAPRPSRRGAGTEAGIRLP